jgi:FMN phosphatase YigB (HAD superfamily)
MRSISFLHLLVILIASGLMPWSHVSGWSTEALSAFTESVSSAEQHPTAAPDGIVELFDIDDTLFHTNAKIRLYNTNTGSERKITSQEFALAAKQLGISGEWLHYEIRPDSFQEFSASREKGINYFKNQILEMIQRPGQQWQGPAWNAFVQACSRPDTARWVSLITAREHHPHEIHEGLIVLKEKGFIKHVPEEANIFPAGNAKYRHLAPTVAEVKTILEIRQLELLSAAPWISALKPVKAIRFTDDDYRNIEAALKGLSSAAENYPDVKIFVEFVGTNHPEHQPFALAIQNDGTSRPVATGELESLKSRAISRSIQQATDTCESLFMGMGI